MVFSSLIFIFGFLPITLIAYYTTNSYLIRNAVLAILSLIFYAWGEPIWVTLLILSSLVDYCNGLFIEHFREKKIAKLGLYCTLVVNLGLLATFKYSDFIVENFNAIFSTNFSKPGFMLPIGISFYTFQTISYTLDVWSGQVKAQKSYLKFILFVSLFSQLVAGPIVRYVDIEKEIQSRKYIPSVFSDGIDRFVIGLFKKVCIANVAGELASKFLDDPGESQTISQLWFGILMFSLQIYFDFSGYSDMAIGLGKMFGFTFYENFNYPYISKSISDFWRRWHISLGSFFRDYVYIPLGGNRNRLVLNLAVVWFLTGLWHGASWNFILWGLYFGVLIYIERKIPLFIITIVPTSVKIIFTLFLIIFGWAIFYYDDLNKLSMFLIGAVDFKNKEFINYEVEGVVLANIYWLIITLLMCTPVFNRFKSRYFVSETNVLVYATHSIIIITMFVISVSLLVGSTYNPFLYFRF